MVEISLFVQYMVLKDYVHGKGMAETVELQKQLNQITGGIRALFTWQA